MVSKLEAVLDAQRGGLFPWAPVFFGTGIGAYFALRFEPGQQAWSAVGAAVLLCLSLALWRHDALRLVLAALLLMLAGFCVAGFRAHHVAEPVLGFRYYGPIEGRIVAIDRSASDALRLTLDRVVLRDMDPRRTPARVRVSLHGTQGFIVPEPGMTVILTGHLSPPGGAVEPGGFDFQRHAWFQRIGAVGYTRTPVLTIAPYAADGFGIWITRLRLRISASVQASLEGRAGGFAAAITTGDRSGMDAGTLEALRASNLAHLLAISGLHMGLLTGFVFGAVRAGLSLFPRAVLVLPAKKIAALLALAAGAVYLALSGGNVATERAFVMVAVALCAIMVNRRAISLRAVAIAATIVLVLRPEALLGPGFQMSFAATTALVAVFGAMRDERITLGPKWLQPVIGVLLASGISGLATAPIGAAHFNAISHYGLLANLLSVPVMGILVVPAAVLALFLAPLGLDWIALWAMGVGLRWILAVGDFVASLDGARSFVHGPEKVVLPMIALGFLWLVLWQGRLRFAGVVPVILAFVLWAGTERPVALIAENGTLVGVMTDAGRALSKPKGAGFIAQNWLENDGDPVNQEQAAARWDAANSALLPYGVRLRHLSGKRAVAAFEGCAPGDIVVASVAFDPSDYACTIYAPEQLRAMGAIAVHLENDKLALRSVRDVTGTRLWTMWRDPPRAQ